MGAIQTFFEQLYGVIKTFTIFDFVDIVLIAYITYKAINLVRETRAGQLVKGILLLSVSYFLALQFGLKTMTFLLKNLFQIGILALIVLFQPEIRRALEKVGRTKVANLNVFGADSPEKSRLLWEKTLHEICDAVFELSATKTGSLIVIERKTRLGEQIDTGVELNAVVTKELLGNIFFVNTPLHDGAVIIRDCKIIAAACFLPKPQKEEYIATNFGSRHRAAIGISEISDAITVVVSEETGTVSVTQDGQIIRNFTKDYLYDFLKEKIIPAKTSELKIKKPSFFRRSK